MDAQMMFILQAVMGVLLLAFGYILNGIRLSMDQVRNDLKLLNDAVLGKYALREEIDKVRSDLSIARDALAREHSGKLEALAIDTARWRDDQRKLDHDVRNHIQLINLALAKMQGTSYGAE